jgi:hypothetical protein
MRFPIADRLDLAARWFDLTNPRPLLGFFLDSQYPLRRYRGASRRLRDGPVRPGDVVPEDYLEDEERLRLAHEEAGGDLVFSPSPFFGLPWVEAALGCGVIADFTTGSTRSVPPRGFAGPSSIPAFSEGDPWVAAMLSFLPLLERRFSGRCPVGVTLMRGISDLLSALYGGERFIERMVDEPDEVAETADRLAEFWIAMARCLLDRIPLFHGGTGSFFYNLWCPGRTIWMQEDASALLSPGLYGRLVHPAFRRLAGAFEHSIVHLHPSRFMPVDWLLEDPVSALELHVEVGGPTVPALLPVHRRILERKPLLVWGAFSEDDLELMVRALPHRGLALAMIVESPQAAERAWRRYERALKG